MTMGKNLKVSIIIPLYVTSTRFFSDFLKYNNLNYDNFEIIVVCDKKVNLPKNINFKTKLILTGHKNTGPAEKRDLAIKYATGVICAFIDDDAYPHPDWLKNAAVHFKNPQIVAAGGSGLTPPDDNFFEKIGGYILESYLCSGEAQNRFYSGKSTHKKFVVDWPAYNLLVRKDILKKIGGYGSTFYGGEDTLLCLKMSKYGKIISDSRVIVFHHRRSFPFAFLKQIKGIGLHRGYFFKKYPDTSRTLIYLLPITLTLGFVTSMILSIVKPKIFLLPFITTFLILWSLAFWSVKRHNRDYISSIFAAFGIILTHITYGISFIKGLLINKLDR